MARIWAKLLVPVINLRFCQCVHFTFTNNKITSMSRTNNSPTFALFFDFDIQIMPPAIHTEAMIAHERETEHVFSVVAANFAAES